MKPQIQKANREIFIKKNIVKKKVYRICPRRGEKIL